MPEGLMTDSGVAGAVHDDPDHPPEPSAGAPRGWTWARKEKRWAPRQRGPVLWRPDGTQAADSASQPAQDDDTGPAEPPGGRDPDPSWLRDDKSGSSSKDDEPKWDPRRVSKETRDDIGSLLGLLAVALVSPLERVDPHCGGALADNADRIIEKCIPLICRSERVVKWVTADAGGLLDWFGLAIALAPVAKAVAEHHIIRTVEVVQQQDEQSGKVVRIVQPVDFSQYAA